MAHVREAAKKEFAPLWNVDVSLGEMKIEGAEVTEITSGKCRLYVVMLPISSQVLCCVGTRMSPYKAK